MNPNNIYHIIKCCCNQLRKGEAVVKTETANISVTEIYDMPPDDGRNHAGYMKIDLHFIVIEVDMANAEHYKNDLLAELNTWPDGSLSTGPSYIAVGGTLGDQGTALCLFALGEALGLWTVITPAKLGMLGADADRAAGLGYIMITGFTKQN